MRRLPLIVLLCCLLPAALQAQSLERCPACALALEQPMPKRCPTCMTDLDQFVETPPQRPAKRPARTPEKTPTRTPEKTPGETTEKTPGKTTEKTTPPPADRTRAKARTSMERGAAQEADRQASDWLRKVLTVKTVARAEMFLRNGHSHRRARVQSRLELGWDAPIAWGFRSKGLLRLRIDDAGLARRGMWFREPDRQIGARMRGALTEGTLSWSSGNLELEVGKQRFSFGKADLFSPTDLVSPRDLFEPFERDNKLGQAALRASYRFGEHFVEAIWLPWFVPSKLAPGGTRLSLFPIPGTPPIIEETDFPARHSLRDPQFAGRLSLHFERFDLELVYLDIYQRVANGRLGLRSVPVRLPFGLVGRALVPTLRPIFPRLHIPGFSVSVPLRALGIELHAEGMQVFTEDRNDDDYFQYVIGPRWTWTQPALSDDELRITLEYGGEIVTRGHRDPASTSLISRPFTQALFGRITYQLDRDLTFEVEGAVQLERPRHAALRTWARYGVTDNVTLTLGHEHYFGPDGTLFGQLDRDGRIYLEVEVKF